jgi:hypothetical protein
MPCEWRGNMANDVRTSLFVTKGNGFMKLKGFLKHDCFVCKLAQFTFPIRKQHFEIQIFKIIKGKNLVK